MDLRLESARQAADDAINKVSAIVSKNQYAYAAVAAGAVVVFGVWRLARPSSSRKRGAACHKLLPGTLDLSGGGIGRNEVAAEFDYYIRSYGEIGTAEGIMDRGETAQLVDKFYSLVTDIYEWGWGTSFHFSPLLPGKDWAASETAHEARIAALLGLGPGMQCLDAGCGVGGPMRTIASTSGANVVGVTINNYQVQRANNHNQRLGLSGLCRAVQGNYLDLKLQPGSFDGAYAIEATCHAPKLELVYAEVFKALKPGAKFVTYEWVATKMFDPSNTEHVRMIDEINYGNGLPEMRSHKQAEEAGKAVGFELVSSIDLATASQVAGHWYHRLKEGRSGAWQRSLNTTAVGVSTLLGIAPKGLRQVHRMLTDAADMLVLAGELGIFSPMHCIVFQKPAA